MQEMTDNVVCATDGSNAAFEALAARVTESMRLEKLSNRELVFEVAHSEAAIASGPIGTKLNVRPTAGPANRR